MSPLEQGQLSVMRVHAVLLGLAIFAIAVMADLILGKLLGWPFGPVTLSVAALLIYPVYLSPARRFHAWRYHADTDELRLAHGVWTKVETIVPFVRVQHIDVAQGPIERAFGVSRLMLHTAGTAHSLVTLPGLSRATAERLRDEIRAHIRSDAE